MEPLILYCTRGGVSLVGRMGRGDGELQWLACSLFGSGRGRG